MKHRRSERGVALIICLFALMLLSGIGLGMMYMADTESSINRNYRDSQQAYFAAVAGTQEARERLTPTSASLIAAPTTLPNAALTSGVVYIINDTSSIAASDIQPWDVNSKYFDTELCHDNFPLLGLTNTGPNTPCATAVSGSSGSTCSYCTTVNSNLPSSGTHPLRGTDANLAYRWVRITLKTNAAAVPATPSTLHDSFYVNAYNTLNNVPICWNGTVELPKPAGYGTCDDDPPFDGINYLKSVYMLTALAVTPSGSRRMTQMEIANSPPFLTNAALDTDDFVTVTGSSVTVNGYDNCKCACVDPPGGSGAPTCTDRITHAACTGNTFAIFSSQTVTPSGGPALVAGTTIPGCTMPTCNPAVAQNQPFPYDVPTLITKYSTQAGAVNAAGAPYNLNCTPSTATPPGYTNCHQMTSSTPSNQLGTLPNPWLPTDPNNPAGVVNQITYVPGTLDMQSHVTGAGILIVDGDLTIHGGLEFYGLIIVRGVLTFSGGGQGQNTTNIVGSIISGSGSVADSIGGGVHVQYDRCALLHNHTPSPPALLANHEVSY
jgi:hypothetical protein